MIRNLNQYILCLFINYKNIATFIKQIKGDAKDIIACLCCNSTEPRGELCRKALSAVVAVGIKPQTGCINPLFRTVMAFEYVNAVTL